VDRECAGVGRIVGVSLLLDRTLTDPIDDFFCGRLDRGLGEMGRVLEWLSEAPLTPRLGLKRPMARKPLEDVGLRFRFGEDGTAVGSSRSLTS